MATGMNFDLGSTLGKSILGRLSHLQTIAPVNIPAVGRLKPGKTSCSGVMDEHMKITRHRFMPKVTLPGIFLAVVFFMTAYEFLKQLYFGGSLSLWESHVITIIATAVFATVAAYFMRQWASKIGQQIHIAAAAFEINEAIMITGANNVIARVNQAFTKITGYTADEAVGQTPELLNSGRHDIDFYRNMWKVIDRTGTWQGEIWDRRKNGEEFPIWLTISAVKGNDGITTHYVWTHLDVTERKRIEESLKESEARFRSIVEQSPIGVIFSRDGYATEVNAAHLKMFGYDNSAEVRGRHITEWIAPQCRDDIAERVRQRLQGKELEAIYETIGLRKDGSQFPIYVSGKLIMLKDGPIISTFVIDISERQAAEEKINQLAFFDHLTELPNRRLLIDRLQHALASGARRDRHGALLFIDLDNFKTLNETQGHAIGDSLLRHVAQRLISCVRDDDSVARFGGDEFVVILEDLSNDALEAAAQTEIVCEKILSVLNQPYPLAAHEYQCTASIGATLFNDSQQTTDELLKQADIAMYQAKNAGHNIMRFFDPKMQKTINARVDLERQLQEAIESRQFLLHYQIQIDSSNRPLGAEALIRWAHPDCGLLLPAQFIPLAEETGQILPIGKWVLETACAQIKAWEQNDLTCNLVLSVNISAKQFLQADFVSQIRDILQRHAINPELLELELTESILLENVEEAISIMDTLRKIGIRFSLDDFGTGYSSLQYLKRLPLDQLKIDQTFVCDIAFNNSDKAIVSTIIAMAQSFDLDVIAEGVETNEQRQLLLNKGCTHFQGYLFSEPLPIEQFESILKSV